MITKITGQLTDLADDSLTLDVEPFQYEVLIPEFVRRQMQGLEGRQISLHTVDYLEGNPMQGRLVPRLIGFLSEAEREFFELFCSVDGVGVRKALRAMVRSVKEVAVAIEEQDTKTLSTLPGIGEATAERIVAKLRRKVSKFALMVPRKVSEAAAAERTVLDDAFQALQSVGHSPADARKLLDAALESGKKFKDAQSVLEFVYQQHRQ